MRGHEPRAPTPVRFGPEGRYELVSTIGTSRTGGVFLAKDRATGDRRALKLLDLSVVDEVAQGRFLAEARVLTQLRHPHVVHAWEHGREQGFCWYAMDWLPNGNLADHLRNKGKAAPEHALVLVFQVLMGLHAIHRAGLVHRDVKLTNVLIDPEWNARVTDFGVAHHPRGTVGFETVPGQQIGTPGYGAPEQWTDAGTVGAAADLFATGVLLYRLVTRKRPDHLHLAHYRPKLLEEVAAPLRSVLLRSTRPEPDERYEDAPEMARAVVDAWDQLLGRADAERWMARFASGSPWGDDTPALRTWLALPR